MIVVDHIIIFSYLGLILSIGLYFRASSEEFGYYTNINANSNNTKLILVATIFASTIGGGTTFGISEKAFLGNIAYTYGLILTIPVDLLIAKYIVPKVIKHQGARTVGDIMVKYYGLTGRFVAGIAATIVSVGFLAAQIYVSGRIFQYIMKVDYVKAVIASYVIVIIYTTIGGFRAVVFTNVIQFFAMICAIPIITIIGIDKIGLSAFFAALPQDKIMFSANNSLLQDTIAATLGFAVMTLYPSFIQRILISSDSDSTSKAIYIKSTAYFVFLILVTVNGLIAYELYPDVHSNIALPHLIHNTAPVGIYGIIIIGLIATVMSTADSDLNVTSVTLVTDIFAPIFKLQNQRTLLLIAKIANVAIGAFAIIIALRFTNVVDLVIFVTGFWGPMIVVPLIFALFDVTIHKTAMLLSSTIGILSFVIWESVLATALNSSLKGVFVGTLASFIVFIIGIKKCRSVIKHDKINI